MTHISIYDSCTLLGVLAGAPRKAWSEARAIVNALAHDAGPARRESSHREWFRPRGRNGYMRSGFRAVNTFRADARAA
jgi:hypothetical protein